MKQVKIRHIAEKEFKNEKKLTYYYKKNTMENVKRNCEG